MPDIILYADAHRDFSTASVSLQDAEIYDDEVHLYFRDLIKLADSHGLELEIEDQGSIDQSALRQIYWADSQEGEIFMQEIAPDFWEWYG